MCTITSIGRVLTKQLIFCVSLFYILEISSQFEMWAWCNMGNISWKDRKTNECVLDLVKKQKSFYALHK